MKGLIFSAIALFTVVSHGATNACSFMPCGVYEGTGSWYDANNKATNAYAEKIEITPTGASAVTLKVFIYKIGTTPTKPWSGPLTLKFDDAGQFTVESESGERFGSGFCVDSVCNVAFRPVKVDREGKTFINAFVNTLRFEGTTLKRYNMVSNNSVDSEMQFQRSELLKK